MAQFHVGGCTTSLAISFFVRPAVLKPIITCPNFSAHLVCYHLSNRVMLNRTNVSTSSALLSILFMQCFFNPFILGHFIHFLGITVEPYRLASALYFIAYAVSFLLLLQMSDTFATPYFSQI